MRSSPGRVELSLMATAQEEDDNIMASAIFSFLRSLMINSDLKSYDEMLYGMEGREVDTILPFAHGSRRVLYILSCNWHRKQRCIHTPAF